MNAVQVLSSLSQRAPKLDSNSVLASHVAKAAHTRLVVRVGSSSAYCVAKSQVLYGVHSRSDALVPAAEMNSDLLHFFHAPQMRLVVDVGSVDKKVPSGHAARTVPHCGWLLASSMSPPAWKVPAGQLFQYWAASSRRRSSAVSIRRRPVCSVGPQVQVPGMATHVAVVTTVWQTRSVVSVGAKISHSPTTQSPLTAVHSLLEKSDGGSDSYSVALHVVSAVHSRSDELVGAALSYSVTRQTVIAVH
jgi:hypothetical protein